MVMHARTMVVSWVDRQLELLHNLGADVNIALTGGKMERPSAVGILDGLDILYGALVSEKHSHSP